MKTPASYTHPFLRGAKQSMKQMAFRTQKTAKNGIFNVHFGLTSAFETNKLPFEMA